MDLKWLFIWTIYYIGKNVRQENHLYKGYMVTVINNKFK